MFLLPSMSSALNDAEENQSQSPTVSLEMHLELNSTWAQGVDR